MFVIFKGIYSGIILSLLALGPSFFYMINVGMKEGFKKAALFVVGILLSDCLILSLILFGLSDFMETQIFQLIFTGLSSVAVLGIGVFYLLKKHVNRDTGNLKLGIPFYLYFVKGFIFNLFNPFTLMVWLGVVGHTLHQVAPNQIFTFFTTFMVSVMVMELSKAYFANWLGKICTDKFFYYLNKSLGVIFSVLSIQLFYHFYEIIQKL